LAVVTTGGFTDEGTTKQTGNHAVYFNPALEINLNNINRLSIYPLNALAASAAADIIIYGFEE